MLFQHTLKTEKQGYYDITDKVMSALVESQVAEGICVIFCPHTTAAITINENADPDVTRDLIHGMNKVFPEDSAYRHMEGNSDAHLKSGNVGASETVIIEDGKLILGTWQGIYFAEFDGPRTRNFYIKIISG